ncbi:MAG: exodeoxyribonuclease III [Chloroflexi bacterium]|nr:exodeoxyribonuclease III [Chloroflexota bacterium]
MSTFKLFSWNVNGIRAAEKKGFLHWLAASDADAIGVQEIKAFEAQLSPALRAPAGYRTDWVSAEKAGYSGVGIFSRAAGLPVRECHVGLGEARFDVDGRTLVCEYDAFVLFNIYFPNGGRGPEWVRHKIDFYRKFLDVVEGYRSRGRPVVVTGDVNTAYAEIDLARPQENNKTSGFLPEERAALDEFFKAGLIDTFRTLHPDAQRYTWWDMRTGARARNLGWRIDYFFVTPDLRDAVVGADIHEAILGSDHCPISLELRL